MKKIILLVFISLMFSNIGFAEMRVIETKLILNKDNNDLRISTYCIDGYKFVEYRLLRTPTGNMIQFFAMGANPAGNRFTSIPAGC